MLYKSARKNAVLISGRGSIFNISSSTRLYKALKGRLTGCSKGRLNICSRWMA